MALIDISIVIVGHDIKKPFLSTKLQGHIKLLYM